MGWLGFDQGRWGWLGHSGALDMLCVDGLGGLDGAIRVEKIPDLWLAAVSFDVFSLNLFQFICKTKVDQCHVHNQILFKGLRLGMANNVTKETFHFFIQEILIFHFWVPKREFFVKEIPKTTLVITPTHFIKLLDHIISTIHLLVDPRYFLFLINFCRFSWKRVQFELQVLKKNHEFLQKIFLGAQLDNSS
jgi:hypothetical protein